MTKTTQTRRVRPPVQMTETVQAQTLPAGGYIPPPAPPVVDVADPEPEPVVKPWRISFGGHSMTDMDATGAHLSIVVALQQRDDWSDLSPWGGPVRLCAWIQALLIMNGVTVDQAATRVAMAKVAVIVGALTEREG